jgi:hypothetical protein
METIPKPELLNPGRVDRDDREDMTSEDHRSRWQLLAKALDESCDYGQQLWDALANARAYLVRSLPTPVGTSGPHRDLTAPTGPDDEAGWQDWKAVYAGVTSVLAGAHGDSGYGQIEADQEAQARRTRSGTTAHPEPSVAPGAVDASDPTDPATHAANEAARTHDSHSTPNQGGSKGPGAALDPSSGGSDESRATEGRTTQQTAAAIAKPVSMGVLVALALRGLRPRKVVVKQ